MENNITQNNVPNPTPTPKPRPSPVLLILLIVAGVMVVGGIFIVVQVFRNLNFPLPAVPPPMNTNASPPPSGSGIAIPTGMQKFSTYQELSDFLAEHQTSAYGYPYKSGMMRGDEMRAVPPMATDGLSGTVNQGLSYSTIVGWGTAGEDYSGTNVQVAGVDEADIIKTDGRYVYTVSQNNLYIVEAYPPEKGEVLSAIKFESTPQDIYVNGNSLVVFGRDNTIERSDLYKKFKRRYGYSFFKVFDIADRKNPRQVRSLDFEGNYANSRMIGNYVYFMTTSPAAYYDTEPPIPRILEQQTDAAGNPVWNELFTTCKTAGGGCPDVYYFDPDSSGYTYTNVAAINVINHKEAVNSDVYLLNVGQNLYVSQNNLYITYTKRVSEDMVMWKVLREFILPQLSSKDQQRIAQIEAIDRSILSQEEKFQKVSVILERWSNSLEKEERDRLEQQMEEKIQQRWEEISRELEKTIIHKISIAGRDLTYRTFGTVPGYVLNQFAMDENNGYFRLATTRSRTWSRNPETQESTNNLYVLDGNMRLAGKVEGLAVGERIYSVRFMQNRAYLVTFRQTDPLFTIDLADPRNPKVLGELKVPGFSDYLHPYDDATLIGIGQESNKLKLSLFDVSDVSNPRELDKYLFDEYGSDSIARREHKAFLFSKDKNLLVIPVTMQQKGDVDIMSCPPCPPDAKCKPCWPTTRYQQFSGAAVFAVDKTGFTLRGKISHQKLPSPLPGRTMTIQDYYPSYSPINRALYIKDVLYTFSNQYLKMNMLSDLKELKNLKLEKERNDDFEIIN